MTEDDGYETIVPDLSAVKVTMPEGVTELLPCPQGCSTAAMIANAANGWHVRYVMCGCGWRSQEFIDTDPLLAEEKAIAAWSIRHTSTEPYIAALREILARREQVQALYDRNGPQWTSPAGQEYESTSDVLAAAEEDVTFIRTLLSDHPPVGGWRRMADVPFNTPVRVKLGEGMTIIARLVPDASMNADEQSCDQWQAEHEGEHPECWTDGACWESNSNECLSMQPTAWKPLEHGEGDAWIALRIERSILSLGDKGNG